MSLARALSALTQTLVAAIVLIPSSGPVLGVDAQMGFPSLDPNDGKFVALAGTGLSTVAQPVSF